MGVYINLICAGCKKSLTDGYISDFKGIGQPFVECRRCHRPNSIADRINEWSLMGVVSKAAFLIWLFLTTIVWAVAISFAIFIGLMWLEGDSRRGPTMNDQQIFVFVGIIALIVFSYRYIKLFNMIRESNARMRDPAYVAKLRGLGLV